MWRKAHKTPQKYSKKPTKHDNTIWDRNRYGPKLNILGPSGF